MRFFPKVIHRPLQVVDARSELVEASLQASYSLAEVRELFSFLLGCHELCSVGDSLPEGDCTLGRLLRRERFLFKLLPFGQLQYDVAGWEWHDAVDEVGVSALLFQRVEGFGDGFGGCADGKA